MSTLKINTMKRITLYLALAFSLPASVQAQNTAAISIETVPPVVVQAVPQAGAVEVAPDLKQIQVTFSKPMQRGNWSWVQLSADTFPTMVGQPRFLDDQKTCVLTVTLKPNRTYAIWLNVDQYTNFKDQQGRSSVPFLLVVRTGSGGR